MSIGRPVYAQMFYSTDISDMSKMEYIFSLSQNKATEKHLIKTPDLFL